jgi:hypothetical protein
MIKKILATILTVTFVTALKGQVIHEFGIGFSGLRIWEPSPPGLFTQDLDFYWNPQLGYQLHFLNERLVAGLQLGWVYARGLKDEANYFRDDSQKSLNLDFEAGVNLIQFDNSFLQWTAGARISRSYFYSIEIVDGRDNRTSFSIADDKWQDVSLDLTSAIAYQINLSKKSYRPANLALRFSLEMIYFFPEDNELEFLDEDYRFAMGPSVSLIWRVRGKKNRGLF